jgi:hypothetical protein
MIISHEYLAQVQNEQRKVCERFRAPFDPADLELKIGIANNFSSGLLPLNGLRHPATDTTSGWYLWAGEELSEADDFFKPVHGYHLLERNAAVLKYLGLQPGWRFLVAGDYEDVWFDAKLLEA